MRGATIAMVLALVMNQGAAVANQCEDSPCTDAVPDVSGRWRMTGVRLAASTCPASLTDTVRERIRRGVLDCDFIVSQAGSRAHVTQVCPEETMVFVAQVDAHGQLRASDRTQIDDYGCRWFFTNTLSAALGRTPAPIAVTYRFQFEPSCRFPNCVMQLAGELDRLDSTADDAPRPRPRFLGIATGGAGAQPGAHCRLDVFSILRSAAGLFR